MFLSKISSYETILLLSLIMPFAAGFFIVNTKFAARFKRIGLIIFGILHFINLTSLLFAVKTSGIISIDIFNISDQLKISFNANKMSVIFCLFMALLWIVTNLYSYGYLDNENCRDEKPYIKPSRYFLFMSCSIGFATEAALAGNLLTLYICYELLSFATYPLVAVTGTDHAKKSAQKYLLFLVGSSLLFFLPAMMYIFLTIGDLSFTYGGFLNHKISSLQGQIVFVVFILGIAKTAIFPLSYWLPMAMVAPHPVSALLHAVAVVKTGIFAIIKIVFFVFGLDFLQEIFQHHLNIPLILALFTIIFAGIRACNQVQIKKILAFSTISHLSVCLMAIFLFTPESVNGAFLYMMAHGVTKITLFFIAGFFYSKYKATDLDDLPGLASKEPIIFACLIISGLSLIGLPFLACFTAKFLIFRLIWENSHFAILISLYILSSCFTVYYIFMIIYKSSLNSNYNAGRHQKPKSIPASLLVMKLLIITSSILIVLMPLVFNLDFLLKLSNFPTF